MREPLRSLSSSTVVLPQANIDTDQIIPARFLTTTERSGLGRHAFADWRAAGDSPLQDPRVRDCQVLVAGDNFGCGSSREHAPWALLDFGFRAVVSTSFADIFRQNAHKNGLLTVQVDAPTHARLMESPWTDVEIDVVERLLRIGEEPAVRFPLEPFAQHCFLEGVDELAYILSFDERIEAYEAERDA